MSTVKEFGYRKPRFQADFSLWVQTDEPQVRALSAHCFDIGEDGIGAELTEPLNIGQKVRFVFTLPRANCSWHVAAKVINRHENQYGFLFLYGSASEREFIHDFLIYLQGSTAH